MLITYYYFVIVVLVLSIDVICLRQKRERAFDLLRLEQSFNDETQEGLRMGLHRTIRNLKPAIFDDTKCQERCNDDLKSGLDMVKAHTAFGSVGVPSVVDESDLKIFCKLDSAHDDCLRKCGFEIQFNMRDYVCNDRFSELTANLPCYNYAASRLKRECGSRKCGPYSELHVSQIGFAQRCRTLVCDLACIHGVLVSQCGTTSGMRAFRYLLDYTRTQVTNWIEDLSVNTKQQVANVMPKSCSRLYCERFDGSNCTYVPSS